jgi:hypothetical protein
LPITYDESHGPWVIVTMPREGVSDADFAEHLRKMSKYFERDTRFGVVIDARNATPLSPVRRRMVAEFLDGEIAQRGQRLLGTAAVLSSPFSRGIFRVIEWSSRYTHPMMCFASMEQALDWLRSL